SPLAVPFSRSPPPARSARRLERAGLLDRALERRTRTVALEEGEQARIALVEAAACRGRHERVAHLHVRHRERIAGQKLAAFELAFEEGVVLLQVAADEAPRGQPEHAQLPKSRARGKAAASTSPPRSGGSRRRDATPPCRAPASGDPRGRSGARGTRGWRPTPRASRRRRGSPASGRA